MDDAGKTIIFIIGQLSFTMKSRTDFTTLCMILLAVAASCLINACTEKNELTPDKVFAERIETDTDVVCLTFSGVKSFTFTVSPSDADFSFDVRSEGCQTGLYKTGADGKPTDKRPENFKLHGIKQKDPQNGIYTATLVDLSRMKEYNETVFLEIRYDDGRVIRSKPFSVQISGQEMFSMSISKELNETSVLETMELQLSGTDFSITSPLISSQDLILTFKSNGAEVLVNGVRQISGKTMNNFSKPVTYRVVDGSGSYTEYTVSITGSGLPVLFIETPDHATIPNKHSDWLAGTHIKLYKPDWTIDYEGMTGIRGRGNSTWGYPKKPYAMKLDSKAEILGMPKHKRWVLLANWLDRTLLRNHIAFKIATMTDLAYTPRGQFVEVYLNGKHNGCYLLCEHIKVDKNRVNVDELEDHLTDSGYIMELDSYYDEVNKFRSAYFDLPYMFKDPDEVNEAQFAFIQDYVNNMEASLDDDTRFAAREYIQYIDVDSFIDFWFVQELTGNPETKHPKSTYMHKNTGGKLTMGPVWDFDWETFTPKNSFRTADKIYYERLFQDPEFKARAKERWNKFLPRFREIPDFIEAEAERIKSSESMNYAMWPVTKDVNKDISLTFEGAVDKMKKSYSDKLEWMDAEIASW